MGYAERAPASPEIPDGKGDHLVVPLPARNRGVHEWSHWAKVRSQLLGTLAGYHRLRKAALEAAAKADVASGPFGGGAVRARSPNRQHNRSAGVHRKALHRVA
jgi:hypothetical protein